jgi:hypothetical protein
VTAPASNAVFGSSAPHQATFIVYINGLEVPAKSASLRYGVWQIPEMQIEMAADPVLVRLGSQDRVQVAVFYYDDCDVDPSVAPAFRLFGEGEITGWGYRNTSGGRSIIFTVVNQIALFTQLFVQFMTTLDDMVGHASGPADTTTIPNASSNLVYPFALFKQGLLPGQGQAGADIKRPFDFLYNTVRGMMDAVIPTNIRTVPAANFFTRWARITNFQNRFIASPFFDEVENSNVFPVLQATQNVTAVDVIIKDLIPNLQNAGSIWDMIQMVYQTMLMEVAMIPGMPLVTVDLASGLVQSTDFREHRLVDSFGSWVTSQGTAERKLKPKRMGNYFPKPQMLFSIPPSCNVMFPSQVLNIAYDENYVTQPTRMYFNDETLTTTLKIPKGGLNETIMNALAVAYPPAADLRSKERDKDHPKFNGKNFLLYPEEFFKGPVMDRRKVPPWLFFLKQSELKGKSTAQTATPNNTTGTSDNSVAAPVAAPTQTGAIPPPTPPRPTTGPSGNGPMITQSENGVIGPNGTRVYWPGTEQLRDRVTTAARGTRVPAEFALAWVNIETGGRRYSTDGDHAKGYFQLLPEECAKLRTKSFPNGVDPALIVDKPTFVQADTTSITCGLEYIMVKRGIADTLAKSVGISWSEADMWRLTKFRGHNLPAYAASILPQVKLSLGHAPRDWEEFYFEALKTANGLQKKALNNATAAGAVLPGATGITISQSDKSALPSPPATTAPATPPDASTSPTAPPAPVVSNATATQLNEITAGNEDVYHLYAKFEYFRERYAKRTGSANVVWNPYVVPGFPGVLFDQRASRVDLVVYITTVQHRMDHSGQRGTTLSYMYGRQFQEMFELLADEFSRNDATARGTAPQEPVRDISKITQSFLQAEEYYQKLFYGAQPLFGKDAAFDFRKILAYESPIPNGAPDPIFVDGPDVESQDANVAAAKTIADLTPLRNTTSATLMSRQSELLGATRSLAAIKPLDAASDTTSEDPNDFVSTVQTAARAQLTANIASLNVQIGFLKTQLTSLDLRINQALQIVQGTANNAGTTGTTRVEHNLTDTRTLVPASAASQLFESRDAALRYNWRPICSLDEYIIFYNSAGEGQIPAFGHARSVGARYFDRIRSFTSPPADFFPPTGADGLAGLTAPGLTADNFPQTRANWDEALLAYKTNVQTKLAPRT